MKPLLTKFKNKQCNGSFVFFPPNIGKAHEGIIPGNKPRSRHERLVEQNKNGNKSNMTNDGKQDEMAKKDFFEL
tara:strand:+ start:265 stop:486 length:222 start_codon:yes stop_codon:yes gene_type:complete